MGSGPFLYTSSKRSVAKACKSDAWSTSLEVNNLLAHYSKQLLVNVGSPAMFAYLPIVIHRVL